MFRVKSVKATGLYKIRVVFSDGINGIADLSHLAGKGIFSLWNDPAAFEKVYVDAASGAIAWSEDVDICPDTIYFQLTGKKPEPLQKNYPPAVGSALRML